MTSIDADERTRMLAAESLASADPAGWFEHLYAAAANGKAILPWDRGAPHPLLMEWAQLLPQDGHRSAPGSVPNRSAMVVGAGLGEDAEFIATFGFVTVAFDIADSAIEAARRRFPGSNVRYLTADLLEPPPRWHRAFDLVIEIFTVQSLPVPYHPQVIRNVAELVAPGGTLLVIAAGRVKGDTMEGPPWPLTRSEIDTFAHSGLEPLEIEDARMPAQPDVRRWRATFHRPIA